MFIDPEFWRRLKERIDEKREDEIHALITGKVKVEDYQRTIGSLAALQFVLEAADGIIEQMMRGREDMAEGE